MILKSSGKYFFIYLEQWSPTKRGSKSNNNNNNISVAKDFFVSYWIIFGIYKTFKQDKTSFG